MNTKPFYSALTIILICFVFGLSFLFVISVANPIGSDVYFHLDVAKYIIHGDFIGAWNYVINVNQFPYGLFFYHAVVLGPIALSPDPYLGLRILEIVFMPLTFLATLWLVWKQASAKAALFTGFALIASWAFIDGTFQARPESLDLLLFPIIIYAVLTVKKKTASLASIVTAWNHGFAGISNLFGTFIYKLRDKTWTKTLILTILAVSPVIVLGFIFFQGAINTWLVTQRNSPQQYMFWHEPFPWIPYYAGLTLLGIPFLLRRHKTKIETLMTYTFIGNTAMLVFWADRWLQYSTIPLAILFGIGISRLHNWKLYAMIAVSVAWTIFYVAVYLETSFFGMWWQPSVTR